MLAILFLFCPDAYAQSAPLISPATGSYTTAQTVTISGSGGTVLYTLDGTIPNISSSPTYSAPFTVTTPTQVNAVVYSSGSYSPVTTKFLDVDAGLAPVLQSGLIVRLSAGLGVIASGSPTYVSVWNDLSGQANNASGTVGSQPTYANSAANFLPAINFNGSNQYLSFPSISTTFSGCTMYAVMQPSAITAGARIIDLGDAASGNNLLMQFSSSGSKGQFWTYNGISGTNAQSASALSAMQPTLLEAVQSGTSATFYVNGNPGTTNSSMNSIPSVSRTSCFLGQASSGGNFFPGAIAEILVYANNLTDSQRAGIEGYLIQKYGILSLAPAAPIISVGSGTLSKPTQVLISSEPGTTTFITTDGSTPSTTSLQYSGCPIPINYSQTLKVVSFRGGLLSSVSSATYTLDAGLWPAPSSSDPATLNINLQLPAPSI
jgi:hypothetical protein